MKKILSFLFLGLMFVSCAQQDNLSVAVEMMKNKQKIIIIWIGAIIPIQIIT